MGETFDLFLLKKVVQNRYQKKIRNGVPKGIPKEHQHVIERVSHPELKKCDFERQYDSLATSNITEKAPFWDPFWSSVGSGRTKKGDPKTAPKKDSKMTPFWVHFGVHLWHLFWSLWRRWAQVAQTGRPGSSKVVIWEPFGCYFGINFE